MEINLCYGCMKEKAHDGPCPDCGFDESAYTPASHHLIPGTILAGKYIVGKVLGEGGFGITYVGWDINLQMKVAIKEYYPNGFVTRNSSVDKTVTALTGQYSDFFWRGLDKFVDEARRLGKFWGLPGIVSVKDYFQENKTGYIVMEFAQGQTLKSILKNTPDGRLPADQVFEMMKPVMKSLEKVHKAGLIHRDISPDNLMVDQEPDGSLTVKLIDFGAARDFMAEGERSLSVMLKPGYAPEEQYRSRGKQGPWTDVYGLCATMYRAITGKVPDESLERMEEDPLERPSQLGVNIESWQEEALMKGLSVFSRNRYKSMEELESALFHVQAKDVVQQEDIVQEEDISQKEDATPEEDTVQVENVIQEEAGSQGKKARNIRRIVMAAAICAAAIIAIFFVLNPGGNEQSGRESIAFSESETISRDTSGRGDENEERDRRTESMDEETHQGEEKNRTVVVWSDSNMERLIRTALGRESGNIYEDELAHIKRLIIKDNEVIMDTQTEDYDDFGVTESVSEEESIQSLDDLRYFTDLTVLRISGHGLTDDRISFIQNLSGLTSLNLSDNQLVDLNILKVLSQLTNLDISFNEVRDISCLESMVHLERLDAWGNEITQLPSLRDLAQLKYLEIGANMLSDISVLEELDQLEALGIRSNEVSDIHSLSGLSNLKVLDVSDNPIGDIGPIASLRELVVLNLGATDIADISNVGNLINMRMLGLHDTSVTSLESLSFLENLSFLDISMTDVTDLNPLVSLNHLEIIFNNGVDADTSCLQDKEGLEIDSGSKGLSYASFLNTSLSRQYAGY